MNYATLVSSVQAYCVNEFDSTVMATLVKQAETRIYNYVQLPALRKNVTGSITAANKYLSCPVDFLAPYSIAVISPTTGAYTYLRDRTVNFIRETYPSPTSTGTPRFYAMFGPSYTDAKELTFIIGPTPDATYAVELHYYFYPESIVTAGNTWLSDNYDPALLYGVLVEAYTYMKGQDSLLQMYNTKFGEALQQLKNLGEGLQRQDSYHTGAGTPVAIK
jgi:hypothetical protein